MTNTRVSERLAYLLRHAPHEAGLTLEPGGWAPLEPVLKVLGISREELEQVVAGDDKGRFALAGDRIRANQGHSVPVDLQLAAQLPPDVLYHGTVGRALGAIRREGLRAMQRQHVHLSADRETARRVGARRGSPVILSVDAAALHAAGHLFYRSDNGVWLTEAVPPQFIGFPPEDPALP